MNPRTVLVVRQVIIGVMIAAFLSMLIISIWYLTRLDSFTLKTVTVTGGETIPHEQIEAIVRAELSGSYFKIVPHTFAFTYPEQAITDDIRKIDRIKDLSVIRSGGNEVAVSFTEYQPNALWCKKDSDDSCVFIDDNGYGFTDAPTLIGGSLLRFVSVGQDPKTHMQAFDSGQYHTANELVTLLEQAKWPIDKVEIDSAGDAFMSVSGGGEFKTTLKQSPKETLDNLESVLSSDKFKHFKPGNFEYVDLRFGNKVFVNEHTIEGDGTASSTQLAGGVGASTSTKPATTELPAVTMAAKTLPATSSASTTR